jgi:hypothetical protein
MSRLLSKTLLSAAMILPCLGQEVNGQVFGPATPIAGPQALGADCIVASDVDSDGMMDLVSTAYSSGQVLWFRQLSPGIWAPPFAVDSSVSGPWHVRAVDLDGDLDTDLVATAAAGFSGVTSVVLE